MANKLLAYDTETTGLNSWKGARPYLFSFASEEKGAYAYRFPVDPSTREVLYTLHHETIAQWAIVEETLENDRTDKVCHNLKFDRRMTSAAGIVMKGKCHCSLTAAKICRSDEFSYELKPLCKKYFQIDDEDEKKLQKAVVKLRRIAKKIGWKIGGEGEVKSDYWLCQYAETILLWQAKEKGGSEKLIAAALKEAKEIENLDIEYAKIDAERALLLWMLLRDQLAERDLQHIYDEEMQLMPITEDMESYGVKLSRPWVEAGVGFTKKLTEQAWDTVVKVSGPDFNPASYPQKVALFIDKLGLEPVNETKKGNPSIDGEFYEYHADVCDAAKAMVDLDRSEKAHGTYFLSYLEHMDLEDAIHCLFDQMGAKTGRFACRMPNFQNVPKRMRCTHCHKELKIALLRGFSVKCGSCGCWQVLDPLLAVRRCFRPRPGTVWILGDYKQIEARIMGNEADEDVLMEAFTAGRDPYIELNNAILENSGLDPGRDIAKHVFLGKIYGIGVGKMCKTISGMGGGRIDEDDARSVINAFDSTFINIAQYSSATKREVKRDGGVFNRYGQWIDVDVKKPYKGVNYKIQSAAARLMKRAMVRCYNFLKLRYPSVKLILTIHDELIFECPIELVDEVAPQIKMLMEDNEGVFRVATPVDMSLVKKTWLMKEELIVCV